jgi:hypothetical protein
MNMRLLPLSASATIGGCRLWVIEAVPVSFVAKEYASFLFRGAVMGNFKRHNV